MDNELRYQAKTHTISEKLYKKKKILHLLPKFFIFYFVENNKIEKQQGHAYGKENNI
jgi:hypothetical protein